jgi:RNA binding exosome subunit
MEFASNFVRQLPSSERVRIIRDLALHCDAEGNLYVRIDKQKLYRGALQLGEDDPIRIKIKFNRLVGDSRENITRFLELE